MLQTAELIVGAWLSVSNGSALKEKNVELFCSNIINFTWAWGGPVITNYLI
jgi:hypothetical protein